MILAKSERQCHVSSGPRTKRKTGAARGSFFRFNLTITLSRKSRGRLFRSSIGGRNSPANKTAENQEVST
jgi:hypothetical protein